MGNESFYSDHVAPMPPEIAAIRKQILQRRLVEQDLGMSGKPNMVPNIGLTNKPVEYNPLLGFLSAAIPGILAPIVLSEANPYVKYMSIPIASLLGAGLYNNLGGQQSKFIPMGVERGMYR